MKFTCFYWLFIFEKLYVSKKNVNFINIICANIWAQTVPLPAIHLLLLCLKLYHVYILQLPYQFLLPIPLLFYHNTCHKAKQIWRITSRNSSGFPVHAPLLQKTANWDRKVWELLEIDMAIVKYGRDKGLNRDNRRFFRTNEWKSLFTKLKTLY